MKRVGVVSAVIAFSSQDRLAHLTSEAGCVHLRGSASHTDASLALRGVFSVEWSRTGGQTGQRSRRLVSSHISERPALTLCTPTPHLRSFNPATSMLGDAASHNR